MKISAKRYDSRIYSLVDEQGAVIALAMRSNSGKWAAYTLQATEQKLTQYGEHNTPDALANAMSEKLSD